MQAWASSQDARDLVPADGKAVLSNMTLLPEDEVERLRVLFQGYYVRDLEGDRSWALTRTFGLDNVKLDLLDLATDRIDAMLSTIARERKELDKIRSARPDEYAPLAEISDKLKAEKTMLRGLRLDARVNSMHAALRTNNMPRMQSLLDTGGVSEIHPKLRAEHMLLSGRSPDEIRKFCEKLLPGARIEQEIWADPGTLEQQVARQAALLASQLKKKKTEEIKQCIDMLERIAVLAAFQADGVPNHLVDAEAIDCASSPSAEAGATNRRATRVREVPTDGARHEFTTAYFHFRLAQELPAALSRNGKFVNYMLSSSTAREFVRTAIKLGQSAPDEISKLAFFGQARLIVDRLARQVHPFGVERAHLLIVEAMYDRMRRDDPRTALVWLAEASERLPSDRNRPRLRMRFLLERIKVIRDLAAAASEERRQRLLGHAWRDLHLVKVFAGTYGLPHFANLAQRQKDKLEEFTLLPS